MNVDGSKIKKLVEIYGSGKNYDTKSYLAKFCEDNNLNYIQWNAYTRGAQTLGIKIVYLLIDIFPNLNLNWLLKDEGDIFTSEEENVMIVNDLKSEYVKTPKDVTNEDLMKKLEEIEKDIKKVNSKFA